MSSKKDIFPKLSREFGGSHPINQTKDFLVNMLTNFGFDHVSGPEIENEAYNFDMLNIKTHPARQMHDTFYVNDKSHLLRTHTCYSNKNNAKKKPPFAYSSGGKVYRKMTMQLICQCFIR